MADNLVNDAIFGIKHFYREFISILPECLTNRDIPGPSDDPYDIKFFPYLIERHLDMLVDNTKISLVQIGGVIKEIVDTFKNGYPDNIFMKDIKKVTTVSQLIKFIHKVLEYDDFISQRVCTRTLNKILDVLSNIDPDVYSVNAYLINYDNYDPNNIFRGKRIKCPTKTLWIKLINKHDQSVIEMEEPCFSIKIKYVDTYINGYYGTAAFSNGNIYKY